MTDRSNMRQVIRNFPQQFPKGLEVGENIKIEKEFENIVICGMGGSALPGDVLKDTSSYLGLKLPLFIHRSYNLPPQAGRKSLIVCISFSGNTEETISAYEEAIKKKLPVIAISTGGKLKELARTSDVHTKSLDLSVDVGRPTLFGEIPATNIQPRSGLGYLFATLLKILSNSKVIKDKSREFLRTAKELEKLDQEKRGKRLAQELKGKIPLIYASQRLSSLARIWKIKFNENSKVMAFWNCFPELNHNEMVGYTNLQGKFHVIILRDKEDHPRILKRIRITSGLMKSKGASVSILDIKGKSLFTKIFSTLVLGDWVSYYLALEYGVDPTPVRMVEELKKKLIAKRRSS